MTVDSLGFSTMSLWKRALRIPIFSALARTQIIFPGENERGVEQASRPLGVLGGSQEIGPGFRLAAGQGLPVCHIWGVFSPFFYFDLPHTFDLFEEQLSMLEHFGKKNPGPNDPRNVNTLQV